MKSEKIDALPIQFVLFILWSTVGVVVCLIYRDSLLLVISLGWYTIVNGHWGNHISWKAKRQQKK